MVSAGVQFLPVVLPQACPVIVPLCLLVNCCALFIRRNHNLSQVVLKYTISTSHNKSQSRNRGLWFLAQSGTPTENEDSAIRIPDVNSKYKSPRRILVDDTSHMNVSTDYSQQLYLTNCYLKRLALTLPFVQQFWQLPRHCATHCMYTWLSNYASPVYSTW